MVEILFDPSRGVFVKCGRSYIGEKLITTKSWEKWIVRYILLIIIYMLLLDGCTY